MRYYPHGGDCCGMTHIFNFPKCRDKNEMEFNLRIVMERAMLKQVHEDEDDSDGSDRVHLYEAVLIQQQLDQGWKDVVEEYGFECVNRFVNENSGNTCYVYHFISGG